MAVILGSNIKRMIMKSNSLGGNFFTSFQQSAREASWDFSVEVTFHRSRGPNALLGSFLCALVVFVTSFRYCVGGSRSPQSLFIPLSAF